MLKQATWMMSKWCQRIAWSLPAKLRAFWGSCWMQVRHLDVNRKRPGHWRDREQVWSCPFRILSPALRHENSEVRFGLHLPRLARAHSLINKLLFFLWPSGLFQPNMVDHLPTGEVSLQKQYQVVVEVWSVYVFIITINECFLPMNFIQRDHAPCMPFC